MKRKGTSVIAAPFIILIFLALASSMAYIAAEYFSAVRSTREADEVLVARNREVLDVQLASNTTIYVMNRGSAASLVVGVLYAFAEGAEYYPLNATVVPLFNPTVIELPRAASEGEYVGVVTNYGNVFWESS